MSLGFEWDFSNLVAILSVVIPLLAFVWEFGVAGRKRLGYRVQMDTPATGAGHAPSADVLAGMRVDTRTLNEPSFVLLRIENAGWLEIAESDYLAPTSSPTGIWVTFPQRRVVGMAVTELSDPALRSFFISETRADDGTPETREAPGFGHGQQDGAGLITLPKVMLNKGAHYKVLAVLERRPGTSGDVPKPVFQAGVLGDGHNRWLGWLGWFARLKMARTEAHLFASRPALLGIGLLTVAVLIQSSLTLFYREDPPPLDCVGGTLHLHGSTAFAPAVEAAAEKYVELCAGKGAEIPLEGGIFEGSGEGIAALEKAGTDAGIEGDTGLGDHIAFTDGPAVGSHPQVLPRPIAYSLYTLVVHKDANVRDISLQDVRDIYAGKIRNWSAVGGADIPIRLVNRHRGSGTRTALEQRVLKGADLPDATVDDCAALKPDQYGICEVGGTESLLSKTAQISGALGYSEVSSAAPEKDLVKLRIDHIPATLDGVEDGKYPYWQTEFSYTYGEPPAGSIAAAFLRYLTDQGGKDILREYGNRPCSETEYPLLCEPS